MKISEIDYIEAAENYEGYCSECDLLTRSETEPDAENYQCPECEQHAVMGVEQALLMGLIELSDELEDC